MHVHLPKPLHGWRAFLGEVGIIVVGVLIALGFEQVVSSLQERTSIAETRATIRGEIADNLRRMLRRQRTDMCVKRRLGEIAAFLDSTSQGQHPKRPTWIGAPYAPLAGEAAFKSAQSAGKFFLLPTDEQQKIEIFYVDGADFNEQNTREWYDWAQLRSLTSSAASLTDNEITRLRQALQDARGADWLIREDVAEYIELAQAQRIVATDHRTLDEQLAPACVPIDTPYGEAADRTSRKDLGSLE
jgi:hypothetical protein